MVHKKAILALVDFVEVDKHYVHCHFKCKVKDKTVIATVTLEPFNKVVLTWKEILFHPIDSYKKYYHTPIFIYGNNCNETMVLKAFQSVSSQFVWNQEQKRYIYNW
jgi:hypothetical protein